MPKESLNESLEVRIDRTRQRNSRYLNCERPPKRGPSDMNITRRNQKPYWRADITAVRDRFRWQCLYSKIPSTVLALLWSA